MKKSLPFLVFAALSLCSCGENAPATCKLTFDPNGGTLATTSMDVEMGKSALLPIPTKEGKQFRGWMTGFGGTDARVDSLTPINRDLSLIAEWSDYDITFLDGQGETFASYAVDPGERIEPPATNPTKKSDETHFYHFTGWEFDFATYIHKDYQIVSQWRSEEAKTAKIALASSFYEGDLMMDFLMRDSLFSLPTRTYSQDLAELSYGLAYCTVSKEKATAFLTAIGFDNLVFSENYETPSDNSIGYVLAHRAIGGKDVISVAIRGFDYGPEWSSNVRIGADGDHFGFSSSSSKVLEGLQNYVETNYKDAEKTFWMSGYSRGGAVANHLGNRLMKDKAGLCNEDNLYLYTFLAPRGIAKDRAIDWENAFNVVNGADLIGRLLPDDYGLVRAGQDIDIYSPEIDEILKGVKEDFSIEPFTADRLLYPTEPAFADYVLNKVISYGREEYEKSLITGDTSKIPEGSMASRSLFVQNYQEGLSYALSIVFGLKEATRDAIIADIKEKAATNIMLILPIIATGQGLYDYLKPYLDEDGIAYDPDKTLAACSLVPTLITGPGSPLLVLFLSEGGKENLMRMIANHYQEVNYALLKAHRLG